MGYKREYKTTMGALFNNGLRGGEAHEADDPIIPEGVGWVFVNGTASGGALYFFWYRDVLKVEE
jgi:hypothetical protein